MGAHQGSRQECGEQHPPLGRQGIHPSSIGCSQGVGAVEGQEGRQEGGKLHWVTVQGHDDALQHAHSSLVGGGDALLVLTACTYQGRWNEGTHAAELHKQGPQQGWLGGEGMQLCRGATTVCLAAACGTSTSIAFVCRGISAFQCV